MKTHKTHIYFLGIGGIGMSALARYYKHAGYKVSGYDKTPSPLTLELETEGIEIHYEDWAEKATEGVDKVVYTPAIPKDLKEFQSFKNSDLPMLKRAQVLGEISNDFFTIAVAGTHGKTTTTSMVAHLLHASGIPVIAFIGGITANYHTNFIFDDHAKIMVVEADEFDRSFLHLHPNVAIVTSMDADHLDIYDKKENLEASFHDFISQIKKGGSLLLQDQLQLQSNPDCNIFSYGLDGEIGTQLLKIEHGKQYFKLPQWADDTHFELSMPGNHNLLNATAALMACRLIEVPTVALANALIQYKGVKRRFEFRINQSHQVLIDDYAHHPSEIHAALQATKSLFAHRHLTVLFQPHLYSRTRDFAEGFAKELSQCDCLLLLDIYPARELPIEGVSSQMLLEKSTAPQKHLLSKESMIDWFTNHSFDVVLVMGAGDIDRLVLPIENKMKQHA
jgi:UDP-N-acetylmuramate--alanine ligase